MIQVVLSFIIAFYLFILLNLVTLLGNLLMTFVFKSISLDLLQYCGTLGENNVCYLILIIITVSSYLCNAISLIFFYLCHPKCCLVVRF
jgi:hypothetical protein